jgi:hypothetical protein
VGEPSKHLIRPEKPPIRGRPYYREEYLLVLNKMMSVKFGNVHSKIRRIFSKELRPHFEAVDKIVDTHSNQFPSTSIGFNRSAARDSIEIN